MSVVEDMLAHAASDPEREVCGLIINVGKKGQIVRGVNVHPDPRRYFELGTDVWLTIPDSVEVIGIYHSHPFGSTEPSQADLVMCEASGVPWHIVNPHTNDHRVVNPSGYEAPYEGRVYVQGILDCYAVIRDWYRREMGLRFPDYHRDAEWWNKGQDLYRDHFAECGFEQMPIGVAPEKGDSFLIQRGARVPNHAAVYLGDGKILHHVYGRLSTVDVYGGVWKDKTVAHLRLKG